MKNVQEKIVKEISKILNVKKKDLSLTKKFSSFKDWDSLKQLEIITLLDEVLKKKKKKDINFSKLTNLKVILNLIKE